MKTIDAIIYSLPIEKIDNVYLVGNETDYYKLFIEQKDECILKIDLRDNIKNNFLNLKKYTGVHIGNLTQVLGSKEAISLLKSCKWKAAIKPNKETLNITLELLKISIFKSYKKKANPILPFFFWMMKQIERDDLIGDIAYDIERDKSKGLFKTYKELEHHVSSKQEYGWDIVSFKDHKKESGSVSPLLCLKLAKMEYDILLKKEQLKKFRVPKTEGYVYFLKPENQEGPIKIGRAININRRISQL